MFQKAFASAALLALSAASIIPSQALTKWHSMKVSAPAMKIGTSAICRVKFLPSGVVINNCHKNLE